MWVVYYTLNQAIYQDVIRSEVMCCYSYCHSFSCFVGGRCGPPGKHGSLPFSRQHQVQVSDLCGRPVRIQRPGKSLQVCDCVVQCSVLINQTNVCGSNVVPIVLSSVHCNCGCLHALSRRQSLTATSATVKSSSSSSPSSSFTLSGLSLLLNNCDSSTAGGAAGGVVSASGMNLTIYLPNRCDAMVMLFY
jgi:hypothetical protein